jgi:hypothetical protein
VCAASGALILVSDFAFAKAPAGGRGRAQPARRGGRDRSTSPGRR